MFDACYVQASDPEDTGRASGTRNSPHKVQEPRANARRLINSAAGIIHHRNALASGFLCATGFASALPADGLQVGFE